MPDLKDKYSDQELNPADFERDFANRAGSPGYDQAHAAMDEADGQKKSNSPDELKQAEESGNSSAADSGDSGTKSSSGSTATNFISKVGGPETAAAFTAVTALKSAFWGSKRRKQATIGAGIAGTLTGGGLLMLFFISGPLELVHLAQTLEKGFSSSENISDNRGNKLLRYAGARDDGETRLGFIGRQYLRGTVSDLNNIGISFNTNSSTNLNGVNADLNNENLQEKFPELKGMSPEDQKAWLADKLGTTTDEINDLGGGKFSLDLTDAPLSAVSSLLSNTLGSFADGGTLSTAMKARVLGKYFNIPSLFHPLERAAASAQRNITNTADAKVAEQQEQQAAEAQAEEAIAPNVDSEVQDAADKEGGKSLGAALTILGGICDLRSVGNDINDINRARIVAPAIVTALRFIAMGSQIESGQDFSASEVNGALASLVNSQGQSVFAGDAMQALEGSTGFKEGDGLDLPPDYAQAFLTGKNSSGYQITSYTNGILGKLPLSPSITCSAPVQYGATLATLIVDIAGEVGTAGAATPAIIGELATLEVAKQVPGILVAGVATDFINNFIVHSKTSEKLAADAFSGPVGGDLLAFGARSAGNLVAASQGGIELAGSAAQAISINQQQQEKQQFQSESFFARMFDTHDYRSLVGRLATSISPSFRQNITNFASDIGNFGSVISDAFTNLFAAIFPHASAAATTTYCWGIYDSDSGACTAGVPEVGIPDSVLNSNDPTMADPYWNACELFSCPTFTDPTTDQNITVNGSLVNLQGQETNLFATYSKYALVCHGVSLEKDSSGLWGAVSTNAVNATSSDYINENCSDYSDKIRQRIMLNAADNGTGDPMACLSGDTESCNNIGFSSTSSPSSSNSTTTTTTTQTNLNTAAAQQTAQAASTSGTSVGFALYDSNGNLLGNYNDISENYGASITKAMILVAYLNQVGSGTLSSQAQGELTAMIENSDNNAANWVYSQLTNGPSQIQKVATDAGMSGFQLDTTSDPTYVLGQSKITASDFAKFFSKINTMFPAAQQSFALNLLSNLSAADQTGLLKSGLPGTVYSKEGWKPEDTGEEGAPYIVNQAAQFSLNGTTYGVAVTVGGTATQASGEAIVQQVVSALIGSGTQ